MESLIEAKDKKDHGVMIFTDDMDTDRIATVYWTYDKFDGETIITSIRINPQTGYQMPEVDLISTAYDYIRDQYRNITFECRGNVTVKN